MIKTKIKKAIAIASIAALVATSIGSSTFAAVIGTASITGGATTNVVWDDVFPGTATGTASNIVVTAKVLPTLNMVISTGSIDLGTLVSDVTSTGNLSIEIGTNAVGGVVITARSNSGGLTDITNSSVQINNTLIDGSAESYTFGSASGAIDSTVAGFTSTGDLGTIEVIDNTTHTIYSTNKPELDNNASADVIFTIATTSNAQTVAGDYQDTITFTVTGNF